MGGDERAIASPSRGYRAGWTHGPVGQKAVSDVHISQAKKPLVDADRRDPLSFQKEGQNSTKV